MHRHGIGRFSIAHKKAHHALGMVGFLVNDGHTKAPDVDHVGGLVRWRLRVGGVLGAVGIGAFFLAAGDAGDFCGFHWLNIGVGRL